jgi:hypothetical protein
MVGYYFAYLANKTNGQFTSVDIDPDLHQAVIDAYKIADPTFKITHITDDSLNLLKNPPYIPNLVHLDSWDVNLKILYLVLYMVGENLKLLNLKCLLALLLS